MTASIKSALTDAFDGLGGVPALVEWGKSNPTQFYQCWSRLAPKEPPEAHDQPYVHHLLILPPERIPAPGITTVSAELLAARLPQDHG